MPNDDVPTLHGPRYKSEATRDLETICRELLSELPRGAMQKTKWYFNSLSELEIKIHDRTYNLTQILLNNPDFEQLEFTEEEINQYAECFEKFAVVSPRLDENFVKFPEPEDYETRDPKGLQDHLRYAEKLALTLYTSTTRDIDDDESADFYETMNHFLRVHGQLDALRSLPPVLFNSTVTQLLLSSAIASQALTKIPRRLSDDDQHAVMMFYRAEDPSAFDKTRQENFDKKQITLHKGITSTTQNKQSIDTLVVKARAEKTSGTISQYQQTRGINPLGKNIKELSMHEVENEIAFPANTQIRYVASYHVDNLTFFVGEPVRSIEGIDPFSYSHRESALRSELIAMNEQFVDGTLNGLNEQDLFNFKNLLEVETNKNSEMMQTAFADFDDAVILMRLVDANKKTIQIGNDVYHTHFRFPFTDTKLCEDDAYLDVNGVHIEKPNHGLDHTMRVTTYLLPVINFLEKFAKDSRFSDFCKNLSPELLEQLQMVSLFYVTGRESEASILVSQSSYHRYKRAAYKNFKSYARKKNIKEQTIQKYENILLGAQYLYDNFGVANNEEQFLFNIMLVCHRLDLFRCYEAKKMALEIDRTLEVVNTSPLQKESLDNLLEMAQETILATGDRLMSQYENGKFVDEYVHYEPDLFLICSTNAEFCFKKCISTIMRYFTFLPPPISLHQPTKEELGKLFIYAIKNGHLETVRLCLQKGVRPDGIFKGKLPLFLATKKNRPDIIKVLVAAGANPNQLNHKGDTPLHQAVQFGKIATIQALIAVGADPTKKNGENKTAIELANLNCSILTALGPVALRTLIAETNSTKIQTLFELALEMEDRESIRAALQKGGILGRSLIERLVSKNKVVALEALAAKGEKPDLIKDDYVLVKEAFAAKRTKLLNYLFNAKLIHPNEWFADKTTPLFHAVKANLPETVALLISLRAVPTNSLLSFAAQTNKLEVVKALLKNKQLDPLQVNKEGESPFSIAVKDKNWELVTAMAEGVRMNEIYNHIRGDKLLLNGLLKVAVREGNLRIIRKLLADDADPSSNNIFAEAVEKAEYMKDWCIVITLLLSLSEAAMQEITPHTLELLGKYLKLQIDESIKMINAIPDESQRKKFVKKLCAKYDALEKVIETQKKKTPTNFIFFSPSKNNKPVSEILLSKLSANLKYSI